MRPRTGKTVCNVREFAYVETGLEMGIAFSAAPSRMVQPAVAGFGRRGIDNRVIFQQNIILQFSVKLVCQSVIACVCYRKRIFMETM